eukprot:CAMPEP_0114523290 /NCGR_PEP_ID=MMETSP0109-20121206/21212_1 /TAXON_ID=29199 /ORGANISM="Chlorarachnion reptans, Strain CCCM449" /LENGTH=358 /DNA_ID=CAMNT_0001704595 /DNA_START=41 /DNA_END=1117 /DNA_ORIENTATION=+
MIIQPGRRRAEWAHKDIEWAQVDKRKLLGSQTMMAFALRGALFPNSVIKTHIQTNISTGSATAVAREIVSMHGVRGLWRGFLTCQIGVIPAHSVYVTGLEWSKQHVARLARSEGFAAASANQLGSFAGGAAASLCAALVRTPTDVIASRLMIQGSKGASTIYHDGVHAFMTICQTEGIRGLYAGLGPAILVSVPTSAIFWGTYSSLKSFIGNTLSHAAAAAHHREFVAHAQSEAVASEASFIAPPAMVGPIRAPFSVWEALVFSSAAFLSSTLAVAVTNPVDLVKTRMQTKAKTGRTAEGGRLAQSGASMRMHLWSIIKYEGWWSLTKGFTSRVMATGPFSIAAILIYEGTKHMSLKR